MVFVTYMMSFKELRLAQLTGSSATSSDSNVYTDKYHQLINSLLTLLQ
jgi:hypothetical protein